jgi:hypothetical protein
MVRRFVFTSSSYYLLFACRREMSRAFGLPSDCFRTALDRSIVEIGSVPYFEFSGKVRRAPVGLIEL